MKETANPSLKLVRKEFDSDYDIRKLAASLGLHDTFGLAPPIQMLLEELSELAMVNQFQLPLPNPIPNFNWNFRPMEGCKRTWQLAFGNPWWGNNSEASSSISSLAISSVRHEDEEFSVKGKELVVFYQTSTVKQIINKLNNQRMIGLARNNVDTSNMEASYLNKF
jgi:hypothetical protein